MWGNNKDSLKRKKKLIYEHDIVLLVARTNMR